MTVDSGKRVEASFAGFRGTAGLVERVDGTASLAVRCSRPLRVEAGDPVTADGREWTIESVAASAFVAGFKLVELRPKKGA